LNQDLLEQREEPPARRQRWRWIGWGALAIAAALVLLRLTLIQGWVRPVRITGGSMADTFYGPHFSVTCRECGARFRCGTEFPPAQDLATCPNCGCGDNRVDAAQPAPGQRVLIDRWAKAVHGVHTWQAVALRAPQDSHQLLVKRCVARGPGQVEIRDGDVYVNGRIQQKTLAQLRDSRVLVHDDRHRSPLANRWQPRQCASQWKPVSTGYESATDPTSRIDWLDYLQWTCWPHGSPEIGRMQSVPIFDQDAYNQSLSRGNLHPVPDIMVACQLQIGGTGKCILRLTSRSDDFEWELSAAADDCLLRWNGNCVARVRPPSRPSPWTVEMAVCDHRALGAVDGAVSFDFTYEPAVGRTVEDQPRLSIGALGALVQFEAPQVYRDIYYLGPGGAQYWQAPQSIDDTEWFMLGDNVPISIDSRLWSAVAERDILGPVRPWIR
jgi:signal peptidase I